ncbi:OmpA family protein [Seohaeicola saemankumensis]|nr:OmpA family protein [Seohaeicola saemankumensis]MCA0870866.1 OmpA family protein [Seohaeicola saemankumensis]
MIRPLAVLALAFGPGSLQALDLPAEAQPVSERISPLDSYVLPVGAYADGAVPGRIVEGRVERSTWRMRGTATTLQILSPLREQLEDAGYEILFECAAAQCGGFDFRFGTEIVPAPDMHVDIRDFRFLSALRGDDQALSLLISRNQTTAYVQVIDVMPVDAVPDRPEPSASPEPSDEPETDDSLVELLLEQGHIVLDDLAFVSGAGTLENGPYRSLQVIAQFLAENPQYRIAFVGHTDSVGSLEANIELSRRRAAVVRQRLIETHGVAADRVSAEGMGYLAPVASNLTPEGRERNRRVEAILLQEG